ncbi:MAG TPA: DMT family transporter [Sporichthyaceae bacterium]
MGHKESASAVGREAHRGGILLGALGVLAFSLTFPATRAAEPAFGVVTVVTARAAAAGVLAAVLLAMRHEPHPPREATGQIAVVAVGATFAFPLLTTLALRDVDSTHAAAMAGLIPAITAGLAVLRAGERPDRRYWPATGVGLAAVLCFAAVQGAGRPTPADGYLLGAMLAAGISYTEGAILARRHGGWRVICWAVLLVLPLSLPLTALSLALRRPEHVTSGAVAGLAYVGAISMWGGFFAWYAGLARGGLARVGRLQLAQPVLTMIWSAAFFGEAVQPAAVLTALVVLGAVVMGKRASAPTAAGQSLGHAPFPSLKSERRRFGQAWALRSMADADWWRTGH